MHPIFIVLIVIGSIVAFIFIMYGAVRIDRYQNEQKIKTAREMAKIESEKAQAKAMTEAQYAREMAKTEAEFPTEMSKGRTCEHCGAPLTSDICEYCGTKYDFKRVQVSLDKSNK